MENKLNNTEKEFQNLAQNYRPELAIDDIWNSIEADLPNRNRRRYFGLFWFICGVAVAGVIALGYMSIGSTDDVSKVNLSSIPKINSESQVEIKEEVQKDNFNRKGENPQFEEDYIKAESQESISVIEKTTGANIIQKNDGINHNDFNKMAYDNLMKVQDIEVVKVNSQEVSTQEVLFITNEIQNSKISNYNNNKQDQKRENFRNAKDEIAQIFGLPTMLISVENNLLPSIELLLTAYEKQIIPQKKESWNWEYGLFTGVNQNYTTYSLTSNEPTTLDARIGHERGRIGSVTDVRIGKRSQKGYSIFVGVGHSLIVDSYRQNERVVSQNLITGVNEISIDNNGGVTSNIGDLLVSEIDDVDISWNRIANNYSFTIGGSVPFAAYKNLNFGLESSFNYRFFGTTNGYYFDGDKEYITKFKNADYHPYKSSGVSQLTIGIPISYKVGAVELVLLPQYRFGINSINNNYSFYNQKSSQSGLQLGIVYWPQ